MAPRLLVLQKGTSSNKKWLAATTGKRRYVAIDLVSGAVSHLSNKNVEEEKVQGKSKT